VKNRALQAGLVFSCLGVSAFWVALKLLDYNLFPARSLNYLTLLVLVYFCLLFFVGVAALAEHFFGGEEPARNIVPVTFLLITVGWFFFSGYSLINFAKSDCYVCAYNRLSPQRCDALTWKRYWQLKAPYDPAPKNVNFFKNGLMSCYDGSALGMKTVDFWLIAGGELSVLLCSVLSVGWIWKITKRAV
jgi:hypothetical protein